MESTRAVASSSPSYQRIKIGLFQHHTIPYFKHYDPVSGHPVSFFSTSPHRLIPLHKLPPTRRPLIQQRQRRPQTLAPIIPRVHQQHHILVHLLRHLLGEKCLERLGGDLRNFGFVPRDLGEFVDDALRGVVVCCSEDAVA